MGAHVWMPPWFLDTSTGSPGRWSVGLPTGTPLLDDESRPCAVLAVASSTPCSPTTSFKTGDRERPDHAPGLRRLHCQGMRAPFPAPSGRRRSGMLVQERGGARENIARGTSRSTLAGSTLVRDRPRALVAWRSAPGVDARHRKRPWLPAVLIVLAVMSHIVVALFSWVPRWNIRVVARPFTAGRDAVRSAWSSWV